MTALRITCDECPDQGFSLAWPDKIRKHLEANPDHIIQIENEAAYS